MQFSSGIHNLTPHEICVYKNGSISTIPPTGIVPRVETVEIESDPVYGFPTVFQSYGNVVGLPEPFPDAFFIVSILVFNATPDRKDLIAPDTNKGAIRKDGKILGVTRFIRNPK